MLHRTRPALLLAAAVALAAALFLTACSGPEPAAAATPPAVGTAAGAILAYQVTVDTQSVEMVVSVFQNDAEGVGYRFDIGGGMRTGSITYAAAWAERASHIYFGFPSGGARLPDKTSLWMARAPFARLRAGETVRLSIDGIESREFSGTCGESYSVGTAGGASYEVPACRFAADHQTMVVMDDADQPLVLSVDNGLLSLTLATAAAR